MGERSIIEDMEIKKKTQYSTENFKKLYHATNKALKQLAWDGVLNSDDEETEALMGVLFEIDGGVYNKDF